MVPLDYNFIFTRVITHGTYHKNTTLRVCVDHVYSQRVMCTSHGSTRVEVHRRVEAHEWKYMHGTKRSNNVSFCDVPTMLHSNVPIHLPMLRTKQCSIFQCSILSFRAQ